MNKDISDRDLIISLMLYLKELDKRIDKESGLPNDNFVELLKKDPYEFAYLNRKLFNDLLGYVWVIQQKI